jgi:hypothetical protein
LQEEAEVTGDRITHIEPVAVVDMDCCARLAAALAAKVQGNACFKGKELLEAERCYLRASRLLTATCGDGGSGHGGGSSEGLRRCGAAVRAPLTTPPVVTTAHSLMLLGEGEVVIEESVTDLYRLYPATVAYYDEDECTVDVCFDFGADRDGLTELSQPLSAMQLAFVLEGMRVRNNLVRTHHTYTHMQSLEPLTRLTLLTFLTLPTLRTL